MSVRAMWEDVVIAEADRGDVKVVEGHFYFPPESVDQNRLVESNRHSWCYWKGRASYYDLDVDGTLIPTVAWHYPKPWPLARRLQDHVAFWRGVRIEEVP